MNLIDLPWPTQIGVIIGCFFILFGCYTLIKRPNEEPGAKLGFLFLGSAIIAINLYFHHLSQNNKPIKTTEISSVNTSNIIAKNNPLNLLVHVKAGESDYVEKVKIKWVD